MAFIELNHYQIANLRELIRTIGYWGALQGEPDGAQLPHGHPLHALDTGDWLGEIWWALPEVAVAPNKTWREQREAIALQISRGYGSDERYTNDPHQASSSAETE